MLCKKRAGRGVGEWTPRTVSACSAGFAGRDVSIHGGFSESTPIAPGALAPLLALIRRDRGTPPVS
jgi:hypothetical protein